MDKLLRHIRKYSLTVARGSSSRVKEVEQFIEDWEEFPRVAFHTSGTLAEAMDYVVDRSIDLLVLELTNAPQYEHEAYAFLSAWEAETPFKLLVFKQTPGPGVMDLDPFEAGTVVYLGPVVEDVEDLQKRIYEDVLRAHYRFPDATIGVIDPPEMEFPSYVEVLSAAEITYTDAQVLLDPCRRYLNYASWGGGMRSKYMEVSGRYLCPTLFAGLKCGKDVYMYRNEGEETRPILKPYLGDLRSWFPIPEDPCDAFGHVLVFNHPEIDSLGPVASSVLFSKMKASWDEVAILTGIDTLTHETFGDLPGDSLDQIEAAWNELRGVFQPELDDGLLAKIFAEHPSWNQPFVLEWLETIPVVSMESQEAGLKLDSGSSDSSPRSSPRSALRSSLRSAVSSYERVEMGKFASKAACATLYGDIEEDVIFPLTIRKVQKPWIGTYLSH